jgi:hypothetical protein
VHDVVGIEHLYNVNGGGITTVHDIVDVRHLYNVNGGNATISDGIGTWHNDKDNGSNAT